MRKSIQLLYAQVVLQRFSKTLYTNDLLCPLVKGLGMRLATGADPGGWIGWLATPPGLQSP